MKIFRTGRRGFTLIEAMIVVTTVGILAAMAVPNTLKAKGSADKVACIKNMRNIQTAVQMWSLDTSAGSDTVPAIEDLVSAYIRTWPKCGGADYDATSANAAPVCPRGTAGHEIDAS
jgi:general secretion pathway protein G